MSKIIVSPNFLNAIQDRKAQATLALFIAGLVVVALMIVEGVIEVEGGDLTIEVEPLIS